MSESLRTLESAVRDGLAAAEAALSELLGRPVAAALHQVSQQDLSQVQVPSYAGDHVVVALYQYFDGALSGHCLLLIDPGGTRLLVEDLMAAAGAAGTALRDDGAHPALQELGNILVGRFLSGMADRLQAQVMPTPPVSTVDMAAALYNSAVAAGAHGSNRVITIAADFTAEGMHLPVTLALIPEDASVAGPAPGRCGG